MKGRNFEKSLLLQGDDTNKKQFLNRPITNSYKRKRFSENLYMHTVPSFTPFE